MAPAAPSAPGIAPSPSSHGHESPSTGAEMGLGAERGLGAPPLLAAISRLSSRGIACGASEPPPSPPIPAAAPPPPPPPPLA